MKKGFVIFLIVVAVIYFCALILVNENFQTNTVEKADKETCGQLEDQLMSSDLEKGKYWIPLTDGESQRGAQDVFGKSPFSYSKYEPLKREKMAFSLFKNEYGWIRVSKEGTIGWVVEDSGCTIKIK